MGKIKYEIRSKVKGKLVPINLNYQDSNSHFRIKTDFLVKQEYWNASKEIIKPIYFDENNFSIEQRNSVEQALNDLKSKVDRSNWIYSGMGFNSNCTTFVQPESSRPPPSREPPRGAAGCPGTAVPPPKYRYDMTFKTGFNC